MNKWIKQALATFRNVAKTILDSYVMLLYLNNVQSLLFTWWNIWLYTVEDIVIYVSLKKYESQEWFWHNN